MKSDKYLATAICPCFIMFYKCDNRGRVVRGKNMNMEVPPYLILLATPGLEIMSDLKLTFFSS